MIGYINIGVSLLFIGTLVACVVLIFDRIRKRRTHRSYKQFVVVVAIVGAITGGVLDRIIGPYLLDIRERLSDIHLYTPLICAMLAIYVLRKAIGGIDM